MLRTWAIWGLAILLSAYAFKDWFKPTCVLIVFGAIYARPDLPSGALGIQGLNPWNLIFLCVVISWLYNRGKEGNKWDMSGFLTVLFAFYIAMICISFLRMVLDQSGFDAYYEYRRMRNPVSTTALISEELINPLKFLLPALIIFDSARDRDKQKFALYSILLMYVLVALQVAKAMPPQTMLSASDFAPRALKVIERGLGISRVNAAFITAGGAWAILLYTIAYEKGWRRYIGYGTFFIGCYALAATGGRTGYGTWAAVGLVLALVKYRRFLLLGPFVLVGAMYFTPGVFERLTEGIISQEEVQVEEGEIDEYQVTSGRSDVWPLVIEKIGERPFVGYGRKAMIRSGLAVEVRQQKQLPPEARGFPHPHNAYLQLLFDTGFLLALPVFLLYFIMARKAYVMFRRATDPFKTAVGGVSFVLTASLLLASIGSQSFYPDRELLGVMAAMLLMLRLSLTQEDTVDAAVPAEHAPTAPTPRYLWQTGLNQQVTPKWRT